MGITRKIVCTIGPSCEKSPILRKTRVYGGVLPLLVGKGILSRDSNTAIVLSCKKGEP
jgi:hypothetical protein